jgi:hypothetical protein
MKQAMNPVCPRCGENSATALSWGWCANCVISKAFGTTRPQARRWPTRDQLLLAAMAALWLALVIVSLAWNAEGGP